MPDYQELFKTIASSWFFSEPALYRTFCLHNVCENSQITVPFRSGQKRIEYNPQLLADMEKAQVKKLFAREVTRCVLGHPYHRQPKPFDAEIAYLASNLVIDQPKSFLSSHGLEEKQSFEYYYFNLYAQMHCPPKETKMKEPPEAFAGGGKLGMPFGTSGGGESELEFKSEGGSGKGKGEDGNGESKDDDDSSGSGTGEGGDTDEDGDAGEDDSGESENDGTGSGKGKGEDGSDSGETGTGAGEDGDNSENDTDDANGDEDGSGAGDSGDTGGTGLWCYDSDALEEAKESIEVFGKTLNSSKGRDLRPYNLDELISQKKERLPKYINILHLFRGSVTSAMTHLTRMRPSRRSGFEQPGKKHEPLPSILCAIDTSGSVESEAVEKMLSQVWGIFKSGVEKIDIITFDIKVNTLHPIHYKKTERN